MNRTLIFLAFGIAALPVMGSAQAGPGVIETDALRRPAMQTGGDVLIRGGRLLTVTKGFLDGADILVRGGKIAAIGKHLTLPSGVKEIDARGRFVTPGLIDAHSHASADSINEWTDSVVAEVRILDVLNTDQLGVYHCLASGITSGLVLHGSANPIGGESAVIKFKWQRPFEEALFPGAPRVVKFALGENPKRPGQNSSGEGRFPGGRMGVEATIRRAFADAKEYTRIWDEYRKSPVGKQVPRRDLRLETLSDILARKIIVNCHSYRQDEMLMIAKLSRELGFRLVLQHALESYKIAPELAKLGVPVSIFGDGFAYKLEVVDSFPMAASILDRAGVLVSINSDTSEGIRTINQDAAKAMRYGISEERALRMLTMNPAIELGIDKKVGSIEVGKDADLAIWAGHPLSNYSKCVTTLIDGEVGFWRRDAFGVDGFSQAATEVRSQKFAPVPDVKVSGTGFLIRGATVHSMAGQDAVTDVLTDGTKILAVGNGLAARPGTQTINAKGMHLYPGFIDAGCQIGLVRFGQGPSATDLNERGTYNPDLRAMTAVDPEMVHFGTARLNGVTNALVVPNAGTVPGQAALVHTAGFTTDDMAAEALAGLVVNVPEADSAGDRESVESSALEESLKKVGDQRREIRSWFESARRYLEARDAGVPFTRDAKLEAVAPYLNGRRPTLFSVDQPEAIRWVIKFAQEFHLKPVILGGGQAWRIAGELKTANLPVILDGPAVASPATTGNLNPLHPYDTGFAAASVLERAGVKFAFRSNSFEGVHNLPYQAGRTVAFGLTKASAMRAITLGAAEILDVADRYGSIVPGKMANMVLTDGDPFEFSTQTKMVFIKGSPASLKNHFTDLWEKYSTRK